MAVHIIRRRVGSDVVHEQLSSFYLLAHRTNLLNRFDPSKSALATYIYTALSNSIDTYLFYTRKIVYCSFCEEIAISTETCNELSIDLSMFVRTLPTLESGIVSDLIEGKTPAEMANSRNVSVMTISTYRKTINDKWNRFTTR